MAAKGSVGTLPSSDEQSRVRRAKKKSPGKRSGPKTMNPNSTLFAGINEDRRNAAFARRQEQANTALDLLRADLTGLARKVAELVIGLFPTVKPARDQGRTKAAEEEMIQMLTDGERARLGAISMGVRSARDALRKAYDAVNADTSA